MKTRAFAVIAVITVLLAGSAFAWSHHGGEQARNGSAAVLALTPPAATATATPGAPPAVAKPLVHRQTVLDKFSCFDCHGVDRGYLMPQDHASMALTECTNCHKPAPSPPPISLHDAAHDESPSAACAACHKTFAVPPQPAPIAKGDCYRCHGSGTDKVFPADHVAISDATTTCTVCHQTKQLAAPVVPHRTQGYEQCTFCHGPGRLTPLDGAHVNQPVSQCLTCHQVVQPPPIYARMHTLATQEQGCTSCHAPNAIAPLPADHAGRTELMCTICHQPATEQPPYVPHPLTANEVCSTCHNPAQVGALPWDHSTRTNVTCTVCHVELPGGVPPIPHPLENRAVCTECHAPGKATPVPGS